MSLHTARGNPYSYGDVDILHLVPQTGQQSGGVEYAARSLARAARGAGRVSIVATSQQIPKSLGHFGSSSDREQMQVLRSLGLKRPQPVIFHGHNLHCVRPEVSIAIMRAARKLLPDCRFVLSIHDVGAPEAVRVSDAGLEVLASADALCTHSQTLYALLSETFRVEAPSIHLAFKLPPFESASSSGRPYILQPTRFTDSKGSLMSIRVVSSLQAEGWNGFLWHTGATQKQAQVKLAQYGIQPLSGRADRVRVGRLSERALHKAMIGAAVIVHPSLHRVHGGEPFGISAAQALATSRPVVMSDSGNLPALASSIPGSWCPPAGSIPSMLMAVRSALQWTPGTRALEIRREWRRDLILRMSRGRAAMSRLYEELF